MKCSRYNAAVPHQLMVDLPAERVTASRPLANTGIDFAGPLMTKPNKKTYIALFVCFATKALHLELVSDLTKEACLAALKRFVYRRVTPDRLFTDNGTNFIGARNDMERVKTILAKRPGWNSFRRCFKLWYGLGDDSSACSPLRRALGSSRGKHETPSKTSYRPTGAQL